MTLTPFSKVGPALAGFALLAGLVDIAYLNILPHSKPGTFSADHQLAVERSFMSKQREGAPDEPVALNPFRRGIPAGYHPKPLN